jgi:hypothetical protein
MHELGHRPHGHGLHHIGAMDLDGLDRDPQVIGDLLVEAAVDDELEHLALPARERRETVGDLVDLLVPGLQHGVACKRLAQGVDQHGLVYRLLQKIDRAVLHCPDAGGQIAMCREVHDRQGDAARQQFAVQVRPRHDGHLHVEQHASMLDDGQALQEFGRRTESLDLETGRTQEPHKASAQAVVVIDDEDRGLTGDHRRVGVGPQHLQSS